MSVDQQPYAAYRRRNVVEKSINSLLGIIEGIAIDGSINEAEIGFLDIWLGSHRDLRERHPYNELIPLVENSLADRMLSSEERQDIAWLCERLRSAEYQDRVATDLQRLHAVLGGIAADATISKTELQGLSDWLEEHSHLRSCWPYDEIGSLVTSVLADGNIDHAEHKLLMQYFSEFVVLLDDKTVTNPSIQVSGNIGGLCAVCPEIEFKGARFCFTGASSRYQRKEFIDVVRQLGGEVLPTVSDKVDYLIIGAEGNPCWMYACYGRKVERAVELRKDGARILIVHESDFHDAVLDSA